MDKSVLGFLADVLYIKGIVCIEEFEAMQEARSPEDLGDIVEKMLRGEFNVYKRKGESYLNYSGK